MRVGSEDGAWARRHHCCVIIVMYGGREGVAGMQTCATGMGMSMGQQEHTCTCGIPYLWLSKEIGGSQVLGLQGLKAPVGLIGWRGESFELGQCLVLG